MQYRLSSPHPPLPAVPFPRWGAVNEEDIIYPNYIKKYKILLTLIVSLR